MPALSPSPTESGHDQTPPTKGWQQQPPVGKGHTRTYQACIPCRNRKVRCDLGEVDNPHPPPCARCQRESKQCYFSATRRKRKNLDTYEPSEADDADDYEVRNGRKKSLRLGVAPENEPPLAPSYPMQPVMSPVTPYNPHGDHRPRTPGGSVGRTEPLRRPTGVQRLSSGGAASTASPVDVDDQKVNSEITSILQTGEIFSGHDALNLLYEAAGRNGDIDHHRTGSSSSLPRPMNLSNSAPASQPTYSTPPANSGRSAPGQRPTIEASVVDPAMTASRQQPRQQNQQSQQQSQLTNGTGPAVDEASMEAALKAWSRLRFVRAGWFTAKEGMAYIAHFYEYMSPLTPVIVPDFRDLSTHARFLKDEPMLAVTLLTIASRHMPLEGPAGATRSYAIHDTLWKYLQGMINRLIWGQEQFGGGFCGAGAQPGSDVDPFSRKGLRTLGTIESLLLMTEWHPRALHFPPDDDGDELVPSDDRDFNADSTGYSSTGGGGQRMDAWLEPCWRSDRICWMLLGNAMTLGFEIGVFDERSDEEWRQTSPTVTHEQIQEYQRRKNHIRELLVVYATQTSGRLGLTSMMPKMEGDRAILKAPNLSFYGSINSPQQVRSPINELRSPIPLGPPLSVRNNAGIQSPQDIQDTVIHYWVEIAKLGELGNKLLFPNRTTTRELIRSGKYAQLLDGFKPKLEAWRRDFDTCTSMPTIMKHILTIEYEYDRVYVNSLALQAVFHRCAANSPMQQNLDSKTEGGAIPFAVLSKWICNDRKYIDEVIGASRTVLEIVVKHLFPVYLRHAPVRTFFRIVSVAIMLLKTFALGATENDVAISLGLLDSAAQVLAMSIVDDVHVGNRFSDLLRTLTARIRATFVRMAANGGGASTANGTTNNSAAASRAPSRSPIPAHSALPSSNQHPFSSSSSLVASPMMPPPQHLTPLLGHQLPPGHHAGAWPAFGGGAFGSSTSNPYSSSLLWGSSATGGGPGTPGGGGMTTLSGHATPNGFGTGWGSGAGAGAGGGFGASGGAGGHSFFGYMVPQDPLQGISTEAYDPERSGVSIMPPPDFSFGGSGPGGVGGGSSRFDRNANDSGRDGDGDRPGSSTGPGGNMSATSSAAEQAATDWLALPLDNLLSYGADVTQTTYGPDVGGIDLLDVLLSSMEGSA